jgi:hypothetical protein
VLRLKSIKGLPHKLVVFLMRANPNPFNAVADLVAQCAIMITNAYGKAFGTPAEFLEIKRRMTRIVAPEPVIIFYPNGFKALNGFSYGHSLSEGQS